MGQDWAYARGDGAAMTLPAPKPERLHWSTMLFAGGMVTCFVALLATLAGIPASIGYDLDGPANRNKPHTSDPLMLSKSIDGNMKWIRQNSNDADGKYVGLISSINDHEAAIAPMLQAVMLMDTSVNEIDAALARVSATTTKMRQDQEALAGTSSASAATMEALRADIEFLAQAMANLAAATNTLTTKMSGIESAAANIANSKTSSAREQARDLNASLPSDVPPPVMEGGTPGDPYIGGGGQ